MISGTLLLFLVFLWRQKIIERCQITLRHGCVVYFTSAIIISSSSCSSIVLLLYYYYCTLYRLHMYLLEPLDAISDLKPTIL